jgi:hypothetical protein
MFIKNKLISLLLISTIFSCEKQVTKNDSNIIQINENSYVINKEFKKGDVRRYGVFPDKKITQKGLNNILDLAESGLSIFFPRGFYNTNLILKGRQNITINFDDASFAGQIQIIEDEDGFSSNSINLIGKVTTYNKFFSRHSYNIQIDTLIIATDTLKNNQGKRSLGCNIYAGTKNLSIKKLVVKDLGSGDDYYKFSIAALQIHGWNNNPENIKIKEVIIKKSDRHGIYITGSNHIFNKIEVGKVGLGDFKFIHGLEDADEKEIDQATAVWFNKCKNSRFNKVVVDCFKTKAKFTINFDEGFSGEPTIIDSLIIKNNNSKIHYLAHDLTNIVVKHTNIND